ncbi:MAG TPA: DUF1453 domain-containing protein [Vicinamibacteria bacterium]|jgi:hypothetical protein
MPLVALGLVLLLPVLAVLLMPVILVLRFRMGSKRQRARGWLAVLNLTGLALSTGLFLVGAAITSYWIAGTFTHALVGVVAGGLLGALGVVLSRWEPQPGVLHYTPSRWLVLAITLVAAGRMGYGLWRAWNAWHSGADEWLAASGAAGSLGAGGLVLGYYLVYWLGVHRRLRAHERAQVESRSGGRAGPAG